MPTPNRKQQSALKGTKPDLLSGLQARVDVINAQLKDLQQIAIDRTRGYQERGQAFEAIQSLAEERAALRPQLHQLRQTEAHERHERKRATLAALNADEPIDPTSIANLARAAYRLLDRLGIDERVVYSKDEYALIGTLRTALLAYTSPQGAETLCSFPLLEQWLRDWPTVYVTSRDTVIQWARKGHCRWPVASQFTDQLDVLNTRLAGVSDDVAAAQSGPHTPHNTGARSVVSDLPAMQDQATDETVPAMIWLNQWTATSGETFQLITRHSRDYPQQANILHQLRQRLKVVQHCIECAKDAGRALPMPPPRRVLPVSKQMEPAQSQKRVPFLSREDGSSRLKQRDTIVDDVKRIQRHIRHLYEQLARGKGHPDAIELAIQSAQKQLEGYWDDLAAQPEEY